MADHECVIGLLYKHSHGFLATLDDLKAHIADKIEFNEYLDSDPFTKNIECLREKVWTIKDYCDRRKSTDLTRFEYCPMCGKKIEWKRIKEGTE